MKDIKYASSSTKRKAKSKRRSKGAAHGQQPNADLENKGTNFSFAKPRLSKKALLDTVNNSGDIKNMDDSLEKGFADQS